MYEETAYNREQLVHSTLFISTFPAKHRRCVTQGKTERLKETLRHTAWEKSHLVYVPQRYANLTEHVMFALGSGCFEMTFCFFSHWLLLLSTILEPNQVFDTSTHLSTGLFLLI